MSDTKNLIAARKRDAQQRIAKYQEEQRKAAVHYAVAQEDLLAVEQDEAEEAANDEAEVAKQRDAEPLVYTLSLTKQQVLDAVHLLGWNLTIPEALRKIDPDCAAKAYGTLAGLQQPLMKQFKAHYGTAPIFKG